MNLLLLSPQLLCYSHFEFFLKMVEIFESKALSAGSLTPVINISPVFLTPAVNLSPVLFAPLVNLLLVLLTPVIKQWPHLLLASPF